MPLKGAPWERKTQGGERHFLPLRRGEFMKIVVKRRVILCGQYMLEGNPVSNPFDQLNRGNIDEKM